MSRYFKITLHFPYTTFQVCRNDVMKVLLFSSDLDRGIEQVDDTLMFSFYHFALTNDRVSVMPFCSEDFTDQTFWHLRNATNLSMQHERDGCRKKYDLP